MEKTAVAENDLEDSFTMMRVKKSTTRLIKTFRINHETYDETLNRLLRIEVEQAVKDAQ